MLDADGLANSTAGCQETDRRGKTTTHGYGTPTEAPLGNVLWENAPAANDPSAQNTGATTGKTSTTYDAVDRPYTTTDASGSTTTTEYDADGLVSKSYAPRAALETTQAGKDRYATSFVYDGAGRVTNQTAKATDTAGPQTLVTDTTYDRDGNIIRVESPGAQKSSSDGGTPPQRVQTRQYDGRDLPWSTTIGTGANRHTTITEYDGNGWLRRTVKPRGVNDDVNPPLPTNDDAQTPFGGNQNRNAETLEYDPGGLLTARNLPWGDGDRAELDADAKRWRQEFSYTPRGVLKTVTGVFDKKGTGTGTPDHTTSVTTNDAGWPTQTVSHDEGSSTSTDVTFDYSYDQQGNQLTWNAGSGRKIRRGYFPSGQMSYRCGVRDSGPGTSEEQIYSYKYDRSGALTNVTDWNHHQVADNGLCDQKAATGADAADNLGSQVTRIGRDKATRPLTVDEKYSPTADRGKDTIYSYKTGTPNLIHTVRTDGLLTSATGAYSGGTQSTFEYDEQDRNTKVTVDSDMPAATKPANRVTDIRFWPSGDQREMLKPAVAGTSRTKESRYYDTAGLISQRTVDPATGTSRSTDYTYDVNGNRTRDERGGTSAGPGYVYNARDQLTSWTRSRNGAAPAETEKDPYKQVTYTLDGSGRQLGTHQIIRADRDDDLFSKITTDVVTTNTYVGDRLTKTDRALKIAKALPIVEIPVQLTDDYQTDCYAYDAMGSQTVAIRHTDTLVTGIPHTTVTCPTDIKAQDNWRTENQNTFDTFERLVASRQRTHPDGNGNDTGTLKNNEAYCYDALDRRDRKLTDLSASQDPGEGDDNPTAFQKARAACTQKQDTDVGVYDFSYLGLTEQLTRENRSTGVQTYEYDATGKRLGRLKAESTGAPTWRAYDTDAQGTVVGLEKSDTGDTTPDDDGKKNTYDIDPYGDPVGSDDDDLSTDAKSNPFQYQGFYKDQDAGNYDMQARAYRPSVGQFLQQDRFADPQGDLTLAADPLTSSRYAFTAANPTTRSEYNGHWGAPKALTEANAKSKAKQSGGSTGASSATQRQAAASTVAAVAQTQKAVAAVNDALASAQTVLALVDALPARSDGGDGIMSPRAVYNQNLQNRSPSQQEPRACQNGASPSTGCLKDPDPGFNPVLDNALTASMVMGPEFAIARGLLARGGARALEAGAEASGAVAGATSITATTGALEKAAANAVSKLGPGSGSVYGTRAHTVFEAEIKALGRTDLETEVAYRAGQVVPRGTKGSVRLDVVQGGRLTPTAIYDLKTGSASLTPRRIAQIRSHLPAKFRNIPIKEIRP